MSTGGSSRHPSLTPSQSKRAFMIKPPRTLFHKTEPSSHISVQRAVEPKETNSNNKNINTRWHKEEFVVRHSEQDNIELDVLAESDTPRPHPKTWADAVMPPRQRRRREKTPDDGQPEPSTNNAMTLESVATVRFATKIRKVKAPDQKKGPLPAFDLDASGVADSASEVSSECGGSASVLPSEPASPSLLHTLTRTRIHIQQSQPQQLHHSLQSSTSHQPQPQPHPHPHPSELPLPSLGGLDDPFVSPSSPLAAVTSLDSKGFSLQRSLALQQERFESADADTASVSTSRPSNVSAGVGMGPAIQSEFEVDPTPTQAIFDLASKTKSAVSINRALTTPDRPTSGTSEALSTNGREAVAIAEMAELFDFKNPPPVAGSGSLSPKIPEDGFDSMDWDPDLARPSAPNDSPEPVPVAPKPVAYTTVGSLVNPNAVIQISAPNRIQREGANRRPFVAPPQGYHHNSYYQPRSPLPTLTMANSMQYAQQLTQNSLRLAYNNTPAPNSGRSSRTGRPTQQMQFSNENEKSTLSRMPNIPQQHMQLSDVEQPICNRRQSTTSQLFATEQSTSQQPPRQLSSFTEQELRDELIRKRALQAGADATTPHPEHEMNTIGGMQGTRGQYMGLQLPVGSELPEHELQVMHSVNAERHEMRPGNVDRSKVSASQTLGVNEWMDQPILAILGRSNSQGTVQGTVQGLEKMQTLQRLAKFENPMQSFAISRLQELAVTRSGTTPSPTTVPAALEELLRNKQPATSLYGQNPRSSPGELDRTWHFPQSGLAGASIQSNNLASRPPGYPQPLTAGPPGQRQSAISRPGPVPIVNNLWQSPEPSFGYGHSASSSSTFVNPDANPESPWHNQYLQTIQYGPATSGPRPPTDVPFAVDAHTIKDTLPHAVAMKYYPYGLFADFHPHPRPSPTYFGEGDNIVSQIVTHFSQKERDDGHYSGQRLLGMTMDEHEADVKLRKVHGPIALPKESIKTLKPITPEELQNMSVGEAAAPLLNLMFRTLLQYSIDDSPLSRTNLSNFGKPAAWQIDNTPEGDRTMLGEDWGCPPQRQGGDETQYGPVFSN